MRSERVVDRILAHRLRDDRLCFFEARVGGDRGGAGAAERGQGALAVEAIDALPGGDQELAGVAGGDPEQRDGAWSGARDERLQAAVELSDLLVE